MSTSDLFMAYCVLTAAVPKRSTGLLAHFALILLNTQPVAIVNVLRPINELRRQGDRMHTGLVGRPMGIMSCVTDRKLDGSAQLSANRQAMMPESTCYPRPSEFKGNKLNTPHCSTVNTKPFFVSQYER